MDKQMDMFADGGLEQDGGTNDPVSGNEVPPGSTQEEVRDDIPAQLSEGEFVFPADVVRFIGLEKLMRMRQEAKMGLKMMEEMGQMGNSDEATIPDDIPFAVTDLVIVDRDNDREYNTGGFVPSAPQQQQFGIAGYTPAAAPTTGFVPGQPFQAASQQFVQPTTPVAQAPTPTMQQYEVPQFSDFVGGGFGEYDELREYRNEAGQVMMIPFKDGNPISPIPEGYTFYDPEETATEEVTTTPTTPQTTQVREESDSDDAGPKYSTTDVSGIGYDRSKLTDDLRDVVKEFGAGFGTFGETFSISGAVMDAFGKDPRAKDSSLTSAALGGVFDAFRGNADPNNPVTFSDPNRMGRKTGQYADVTPLHEMSTGQQDRIARVAKTVVGGLRDVFVDKKTGKTKTVSEVDSGLSALAKTLNIQTSVQTSKGVTFKSRATLIREISNEQTRRQIEADNAAAQKAAEERRQKMEEERQKTQNFGLTFTGGDPGESDRTVEYGGQSYSVGTGEGGSVYTGGAFGGSPFGGFAEGGLAGKPKPKKRMKRGGLASKK